MNAMNMIRRKRLSLLVALLLAFGTALAGCVQDEGGEEAGGDDTIGEQDDGVIDDTGDGDDQVGDDPEDAGSPETVELFVTAHDDAEGQFWFEIEELEGPNPTLTLEAGQPVSIHFENVGEAPHNLHIGGPIDQATEVIQPGEFVFLNFTVPEEDEFQSEEEAFESDLEEEQADENAHFYWCDPHRGQGMVGELELVAEGEGVFGGEGSTGETGDEGGAETEV